MKPKRENRHSGKYIAIKKNIILAIIIKNKNLRIIKIENWTMPKREFVNFKMDVKECPRM